MTNAAIKLDQRETAIEAFKRNAEKEGIKVFDWQNPADRILARQAFAKERKEREERESKNFTLGVCKNCGARREVCCC